MWNGYILLDGNITETKNVHLMTAARGNNKKIDTHSSKSGRSLYYKQKRKLSKIKTYAEHDERFKFYAQHIVDVVSLSCGRAVPQFPFDTHITRAFKKK